MPPPSRAGRSPVDVWWRQLQASPVQRPGVSRRLDGWVTRGGRLCLVGPRGSGRTRFLSSVIRSVEHDRRSYVLITPGRFAGAALHRAMVALGLAPDVPLFGDAARRARYAAARLVSGFQALHGPRPIPVVVDDIDLLDPLTRTAVTALLREPTVQLVATSCTAVDELDTLAVPPLDAVALAELGVRGTTAEPLHIGAALALRADPEAGASARDGWTSVPRMRGLQPHAAQLLELLAVSCSPVARSAVGRTLGLELSEVARACRQLLNRGLVVEWAGGLRLASPVDARAIEGALETDPQTHARAGSLLSADHPAQVPHAVAAPPDDLRVLEGSLRALVQWDPARATRWGRALLQREAPSVLVKLTADAAMACRRRDIAARILQEAGPLCTTDFVRSAVLAQAGLYHLDSPADVPAARRALRQARAAGAELAEAPAELHLLESRLRLAVDGPALAHAQLRAAHDARPVFDETPAGMREHEAQVFVALRRLDDARRVWARLFEVAELPRRERVAQAMATELLRAQRPLDASAAMVQLAHADREVRDTTQARALDKAAHLALGGGDPGAAITHWTAALALAETLHATGLVARVRPRLAAALREVGRSDEAMAVVQAALDDAATPDLQRLECALIAGDLALAANRSGEAERWIRRADALLSASFAPSVAMRVERRRCELAVLCDDPGALSMVTAAAQAAHRAEAPRELSRLHAMRGYLLARARRSHEVGPSIERAEAPLRDAGAGRLLAEVRIWAARSYLAVGELDGARKAAAKALVWADETGHIRLREEARGLLDVAQHQPGQPTERFDRLLEISTAIASERRPERIYQRTVAACAELLEADRAFCVEVAEGGPEVVAAWRGDGRPPGTPSTSVVRAVLSHGRDIAVGDVGERAELRARDSIVETRVRSVMCVPMVDRTVDGARILGVLYVDSPARSKDEIDRGLRTLRALAAQTAVALSGARLLAAAEARTRRATEMAHDLRSPSAALRMAGEELSSALSLPEWTRQTGELIARQSQRLLDIGDRYLSDRRSDPTIFSLGELAREVGRVTAPLARAIGRSVLVDVMGPVLVEAAEDDIQRVLVNLVQNGIRHTPVGTAVQIVVEPAADGRVTCRVTDQGPGVPEALLPHIFDRGVRGSTDGHGLGLAISRGLAHTWGGTVAAENLPDRGACFSLTLPVSERSAVRAR